MKKIILLFPLIIALSICLYNQITKTEIKEVPMASSVSLSSVSVSDNAYKDRFQVDAWNENGYSKLSTNVFSFEYPSDWRITLLKAGALMVSQDFVIDSDSEGYSINRSGSELNFQYTETNFESAGDFFENNDNHEFLKSNSKVIKNSTYHGRPALIYDFRNHGMQSLNFIVIFDHQLYTVTYNYSDSTKERDQEHFEHLLNTLELKNLN